MLVNTATMSSNATSSAPHIEPLKRKRGGGDDDAGLMLQARLNQSVYVQHRWQQLVWQTLYIETAPPVSYPKLNRESETTNAIVSPNPPSAAHPAKAYKVDRELLQALEQITLKRWCADHSVRNR
jgi:hypothetical protein